MSGVIGVYALGGDNAAQTLFYGLAGMQHRGEEGCGVSLNLHRGFFTPAPDYQLVYYYFRDLGKNLKDIERFGIQIESLLKEVPSVQSDTVLADRIVGKPYLEIDINREAVDRYGIHVQQVQEVQQGTPGPAY